MLYLNLSILRTKVDNAFFWKVSLEHMNEHLKERPLIQPVLKDIFHFLSNYRDEKEPNRTKSVCETCGWNVCKKYSSIAINCLTYAEKSDPEAIVVK